MISLKTTITRVIERSTAFNHSIGLVRFVSGFRVDSGECIKKSLTSDYKDQKYLVGLGGRIIRVFGALPGFFSPETQKGLLI
jgi:hypothetical protein